MKEKLRHLLAQREKRRIVDADRVPSAVLLPLYRKQGQDYILFIRRTETVKTHKGQISFPGGTYEDEDRTMLTTALRECREEIGLNDDIVEVLGELDDQVTTTSNYIVSPFVAAISWPYRFTISKDEVDEIIEIPVPALLDKSLIQQDIEILNGKPIEAYTYHYDGRVIWGATSRILNQFLRIYEQAMRDSDKSI